jgi:transposase
MKTASTELEKAQAFTRVACGESIHAVAADIGRSYTIVQSWCHEAGIVDIPHFRGAAHEERRQQANKRRLDACELARDGFDNYQIANLLGISLTSAARYTRDITRPSHAARR